MSKKESLGEYAKILYIVHGLSLKDIEAKLQVSYRALQDWKKDGGWDIERSRIMEAEGMVHSSLYAEFAKELRMLRLNSKEELDPKRCKTLESLAKTMQNMFAYEQNAPKKSSKKSHKEIAEEIDKIIRGET